jgi:hypothetical protein
MMDFSTKKLPEIANKKAASVVKTKNFSKNIFFSRKKAFLLFNAKDPDQLTRLTLEYHSFIHP